VRYRIGLVWMLGVVVPAVAARHWPADASQWATWLLACLVSLVLWLSVVEALARVRSRAAGAAWPPTLLLALLVPLWIAGSHAYWATLHSGLPPSAVWFCCRNPRYSYVLACEATTPAERALIVASPLVLLALLYHSTRRPLPPAPFWLSRGRLVAASTALLLLAMPGAARTADLEGLRATVGGVAMYLVHERPHLGRPARVRPSLLPAAADRPNIVVVIQESMERGSGRRGTAGPARHRATSSSSPTTAPRPRGSRTRSPPPARLPSRCRRSSPASRPTRAAKNSGALRFCGRKRALSAIAPRSSRDRATTGSASATSSSAPTGPTWRRRRPSSAVPASTTMA
jgi:hypothetical protein